MTTDSLLFAFLVFTSTFVSAQNTKTDTIPLSSPKSSTDIKIRKPMAIEGGFMLGATAYSGDLEPSLAETRPLIGLFVRRSLGDYFALQATLSQGVLAGSDAHSTDISWRMARNIQFKTSITELSLRAELHFLSTQHKISALSSGISVLDDDAKSPIVRKRSRRISPFIYIGGGGVLVNPKTDFNDSPAPNPITEATRIAADKTYEFEKIHFILPVGGGLRMPLVNQRMVFTLEGGFRPTFSDYIDGMSIAGNPNANDWYFMGNIGLSKTLGYTKDSDKDGIVDKFDKCPFLKGDSKLDGCPDRDGDGVTDDKDECPTIAGLKNFEGCPDSDGDGIADKFDNCPTIPGSGRYKGCPEEQKDSAIAQNTLDTTQKQTVNPVVQFTTDTIKTLAQTDTSTQKLVSNQPETTTPSKESDEQQVSQNTIPETIKPLDTDTLKAKMATHTPTSAPVFVNQKQTVDTTTNSTKANVETVAPLAQGNSVGQKETPQYSAEKTNVATTSKPLKDSILVEKPIAIDPTKKETPQYSAEKTNVATTSKPLKDSILVEKPIAVDPTKKETPQYSAEKPIVATTSKPLKDSIVVEKPITVEPTKKETPQYSAEKPIVAEPTTKEVTEKPIIKESIKTEKDSTVAIEKTTIVADTTQNTADKSTVNVDSLVMAIEKPVKTVPTKSITDSAARTNVKPTRPIIPQTIPPQMDLDKPVDTVQTVVTIDTFMRVDDGKYNAPFPTGRTVNPYLDAASVGDSAAFRIVRNHYTISPVYFDHSKSIYQSKSLAILDEIAFIMLENKDYRLRIVGHTDGTGTKSSNLILSVNRAKMCYLYLVNKGVPARRITFKGIGQSQPAADNDSEESRQLNRRVEFEIITD